ncbi:hypothetical protein D3C80_1856190 [compost metagenome]
MQSLIRHGCDFFHRTNTDLQMLCDLPLVELCRHARQFQFAMQRLVGNTEQRAVWDAEAEPIGCNRGGLHVERDCTRL